MRISQIAGFLLMLILATNAWSQDLRGIAQLARDGAPELALQLLDKVQPDPQANLPGWLFFERQRIDILRHWQEWQTLLARLEQLPANTPADFQHWARVEAANAHLQAGRGAAARKILRQLIWRPAMPLKTEQFSIYRRLIIRSYLIDDNLRDAQRAMLRYQQDYGNKGREWRKLQARVLLRTDRANDATRLLAAAETPDPDMQAMLLLAQLRSSAQTPEAILGEVRRLVKDKKYSNVDKARLWRVGAEASKSFQGRRTLVKITEQAMLLAYALPKNEQIFTIHGDDLWDAYRDYGMEEGNKLQLLIGQDERWLQEAEQWFEKRPERARAFYVALILNATSAASREQAYARLLESIQTVPDGIRLLHKLFLGSALFPTSSSIPDSVRYLLVDDALSRNDIGQATRLMSGLENAPAGSDEFEWGLRRARVVVLGGQHDEGIQVLQQLTHSDNELDNVKIDRVIQVVFDLQKVGRHQAAIDLFMRLLKRPLEQQVHRELLFWIADSYKALNNSAKAAWYYLQSATLLDAIGLDPWGQTARFRAAEVLADAGLTNDAKRLYEGLMKVTREPSRRAMLKNKLQELWLQAQ